MNDWLPERLRVLDSHTGGEPTRVVIDPIPQLASGSMAERRSLFSQKFDALRSAVVNEPRGSDVVVGALLLPPAEKDCDFGVIFFNNVGMLGMCVHGTIGVVATLAHMGKIKPGIIQFDTPVGKVRATLEPDGHVSVHNVLSYRYRKDVTVSVPGYGDVKGDIAWGGNWFLLVNGLQEQLVLSNVERLTDVTWRIRQALQASGISGEDGGEIDHIELFGPPLDLQNNSRNFVLCPGKAYDRSPCGTGTSAKLACLFADGKLKPGQIWRQESILGSVFEGSVEALENGVVPCIRGTAHMTAESTLLLNPHDPFRAGLRP